MKWVSGDFPDSQQTNGRPGWEPPLLDLADLFEPDKYGKQRDALVKYYNGDAKKAAEYLDASGEYHMLLGVFRLDLS